MTFPQACVAISLLCPLAVVPPRAPADTPADRVATVAVPNGGKPVVARPDKSGAIHLLYDTADGPRYAKSSDGGHSFGTPVPVVADSPRTAGLEYSGWDMAVGKNGRVHVAMGTNAWKLKLPQEEWGFFHATLDPGATAFSPVRNINKKPSEGFSLAADDKGNVTACWLSDRLYANVSHDNGETFAPYAEIDPRLDPCNCCTTSAAYGADGRLAVLYREETNDERDMHLVLWDQSKNKTTTTRLGHTRWKIDACPMTYFAVEPVRGGYLTVWPTKGQIGFARLNDQGRPSSPALDEIPTPGRSGMRTGVLALAASDGTTLVAWKLEGRTGWQLYDPDGQPIGPPGSVKSPGNGVAGVVGVDGRFVLFR